MADPNQTVNEEESVPSQEVIQEEPEATGTASPEQETTEQGLEQPPVQSQDVDEHGVPWKNRAMEIQRKYDETVSNLPKIVEETVAKATAKPTERKYTIEELERIALENPNLRPQVEAEKAKLIEERIERKNQEFVQNLESKKQAEVQKYQAEQWVLTHPKFKECFIEGPGGAKQWNLANPLTQAIQTVMSNPEIKNRPDALAVAARVAYGDYMLAGEPRAKAQVKNLQKEVRVAQKKTLVEGSGNQTQTTTGDPLKLAQENLRKTGSRSAAEVAVKEHLKKMGLVT